MIVVHLSGACRCAVQVEQPASGPGPWTGVGMSPAERPSTASLVLTIIGAFLSLWCCICTGIAAVVVSVEVRSAYIRGLRDGLVVERRTRDRKVAGSIHGERDGSFIFIKKKKEKKKSSCSGSCFGIGTSNFFLFSFKKKIYIL